MMENKKIKVLLADDHPLMLLALRTLFEAEPDIEIVGEAMDGEEAVRLASELLPQVIIMDIAMPKLNGLDATRQIKQLHSNIAVLVLTMHDDRDNILGIIEAGAAGYVTKTVFGKEVCSAIRAVVDGETVFSPEVTQRLLQDVMRYSEKPQIIDNIEKITKREREILKLAANGLSNKEIAARLDLALGTIKAYTAELFEKLNVGSRTEAVVKALRGGLLSIDDLD